MKNVALLLMAAMALLVVGCSDDSTTPVSVADQSASMPGHLAKNFVKGFMAYVGPISSDPAEVVIDPGITNDPDGKTIVKGMVLRTFFTAVFPPAAGGPDLLTGNGVLELNFRLDPGTGALFCWGKLTVDPAASEAGDGVWDITWQGKGTYYDETGAVYPTVPLKLEGHGNGGTLTGMQISAEITLIGGPPVTWGGAGEGSVTSH
jgi:hypothetical protein